MVYDKIDKVIKDEITPLYTIGQNKCIYKSVEIVGSCNDDIILLRKVQSKIEFGTEYVMIEKVIEYIRKKMGLQ